MTIVLHCFTSWSAHQVLIHSPQAGVQYTGFRLGAALQFCAWKNQILLPSEFTLILIVPPLHYQLTILFNVNPFQRRNHSLVAPARLHIPIRACWKLPKKNEIVSHLEIIGLRSVSFAMHFFNSFTMKVEFSWYITCILKRGILLQLCVWFISAWCVPPGY